MQAHVDLHLVGDDWLLRVQRWLRAAPPVGLGIQRRAISLALFAWLPIVILTILEKRPFPIVGAKESLFDHYVVHAQCLVAIPLFVIGEAVAQSSTKLLSQSICGNELIGNRGRMAFEALIRVHGHLRRSPIPWIFIVGITVAWVARGARIYERHPALVSGADLTGLELSLAGAWYVYVTRSVFGVLLLGWLWRLLLWWHFLARFTRLPLDLVPTHPDRVMGLGFFERTPAAFSALILGVSSVLAAEAAHQIVFHNAELSRFYGLAGVYGATTTVLILAPLLTFLLPLTVAKRSALVHYGAFVTRHDRLVRQRWVDGREVEDQRILEAPELGPVADVGTLYQAIVACRYCPIGKPSLLAVLLPLAIPMLLVSLLKIPLGDLLSKLVGLVF
ncbi:MAG TPA: hypothetical protein VIM73_01020 [Polyangiaceae bacterium]